MGRFYGGVLSRGLSRIRREAPLCAGDWHQAHLASRRSGDGCWTLIAGWIGRDGWGSFLKNLHLTAALWRRS